MLQYEFSAEVLSHTKPTKGEKKSRSILYGPFADVAPLTLAPAEFHYVNNAPFAEANTLERTFDIVWNTIHVEERYVVVSRWTCSALACMQRSSTYVMMSLLTVVDAVDGVLPLIADTRRRKAHGRMVTA